MIEDIRTCVVRIDEKLYERACKGRKQTKLIVFKATLLNGSGDTVTFEYFLVYKTAPAMMHRLSVGTIVKLTAVKTNHDRYKVTKIFDTVHTTNIYTKAYETYVSMCESADIDLDENERAHLRKYFEDRKNKRHIDLTLASKLAQELGWALKLDGLETQEQARKNMAHLFSHMSGLVLSKEECARVYGIFEHAALS